MGGKTINEGRVVIDKRVWQEYSVISVLCTVNNGKHHSTAEKHTNGEISQTEGGGPEAKQELEIWLQTRS